MNILAICTANRCRSKTLEALLNATPGFLAKSAGTHPIGDGRAITEADLQWADRIIVFERWHSKFIRNTFWTLFPTLPITLFDIPDEYEPFDPDLIQLLREQCQITFGITPEIPVEARLRGPIIRMEPLGGGHQRGKMLVTFADGSKGIFKPASGEGRRKAVPVDEPLASFRISLLPDELPWFTKLVAAWGEGKVLRMWESLRMQLKWTRNL